MANGLCQKHMRLSRPVRKDNRLYKPRKRVKSKYVLAGDSRWVKLSRIHLASNPLCVRCQKRGRVVRAKEVDHIKPARKYPELKYESSNFQSLCRPCHGVKTMRFERKGIYPDYARGVNYVEESQ